MELVSQSVSQSFGQQLDTRLLIGKQKVEFFSLGSLTVVVRSKSESLG
jgi:hypothetical protein